MDDQFTLNKPSEKDKEVDNTPVPEVSWLTLDNVKREKRRKPYTEAQLERRAEEFKSAFPNLHKDPDYSKLDEELKSSSVILIRHASSHANHLSE